MKQAAIQVGKVYVNRGKGRTRRTVLEIGKGMPVPHWGREWGQDVDGVRYEQDGNEWYLTLKSFAHWAGGEAA